jgi:CRP-like cAMP-binding protein
MNHQVSLFDEISAISLFKNFTNKELVTFVRVCEQKDFIKGDTIFQEGDPSTEIVILVDGCLEIFRSNRAVVTIEDKGLAGEMGVFTNEPRSATITAIKDSITLIISRDKLHKLILEDKDIGIKIYQNVIQIISENLRRSNMMFEFYEMIS